MGGGEFGASYIAILVNPLWKYGNCSIGPDCDMSIYALPIIACGLGS